MPKYKKKEEYRKGTPDVSRAEARDKKCKQKND